jgi:fatty-acyl-CoA synthase
MDLSDLIDRNAAFTPDKPALHFTGATLTYAALADRIARTARALHAGFGVRRGDRVAILSANRPEYLILLYACARLGAMLVPLNWRLAPPEIAFILKHAGPRVLLLEEEFHAAAALAGAGLPLIGLDYTPAGGVALDEALSAEAAHPYHAGTDDPLLIVYTSGTTGRPKGAVLTQQALLANGVMSQHMHGMTANDHVLTVLPMFHVGGLNIQTTAALHLGATVTLHARFHPRATLHAIASARPNLIVLVPATIQALIDHPDWTATHVSSLRAVTTGSSIVPQALVDALTARGIPVLQVYGATETCPIAIYTRLGGDLSRAGSTGLPGLLCEARVVDEQGSTLPPGAHGEILVRGPNVLVHYWADQAATAEALQDGWFHTGDIASRDHDGYFTIHERRKNMIVSGGENIYPAEIERVLLRHPDVAEAAVIGAPDPRWQEVPVAFIVAKSGCSASAQALRDFLAGEIARFKLPREIILVDSLPRTALGKVQHFRLHDLYAERNR